MMILLSAFVFVSSMLLFGDNGYAYVDPTVITYLIQGIAGIVIAIGTVVGLYWRRAKKRMQDRLGIHEDKEKETDDIIINDED